MSKAGYHWPPKTEPRDAPCFICNTEPRLEGHSVCSGCHRDDGRCWKCYPELSYAIPVLQSRGLLSGECEEGHAA